MSAAEIELARSSLPPEVRQTPVIPFDPDEAGSDSGRLLLKLESLQLTGSYKIRAAFFLLGSLDERDRRRGLVIASSGNFGKAFAFAGRRLGVPVVVVCPPGTSESKIRSIRQHGAQTIPAASYVALEDTVAEAAESRRMLAIQHTGDRRVAIGHSTVGSEILEAANVSTVVVPVSAGGLISGVASAIKLRDPSIRVIGVQPSGVTAMYESWKAARPVVVTGNGSVADALSATAVHPFALEHVRHRVDDIVLVEDSEIVHAMLQLGQVSRVIAEPAGAAALAACLSGRVRSEGVSIAIVTGGNIPMGEWMKLVGRARRR